MNSKVNLSVLFAVMLICSLAFIESCSKKDPDSCIVDCHMWDPGPIDDDEPSDDDCEIIETEEDYEKILSNLGPLSLTVKKSGGENCADDKCEIRATFSLSSVGGCEVRNSVSKQHEVTVQFDKDGSTGEGSHLCPLNKKNVVLKMSLTYKGRDVDVSDQSVIIGGRVDRRNIMVGVIEEDEENPYNFFHANTKITQLSCPESKKLKIRDLCENTYFDDQMLRKCWTNLEDNNNCPPDTVLHSLKCRKN